MISEINGTTKKSPVSIMRAMRTYFDVAKKRMRKQKNLNPVVRRICNQKKDNRFTRLHITKIGIGETMKGLLDDLGTTELFEALRQGRQLGKAALKKDHRKHVKRCYNGFCLRRFEKRGDFA